MRLFWMLVAAFRRDRNEYVEMSSERRQMNIRYEFLVVLFALLFSSAAHAQKLTPAQAAEILRNGPGLSNRTNAYACIDCIGPRAIFIEPRFYFRSFYRSVYHRAFYPQRSDTRTMLFRRNN